MGLGSALLRLGGVWIQSVGGVKRLIALYYGKIENITLKNNLTHNLTSAVKGNQVRPSCDKKNHLVIYDFGSFLVQS